MAIAKIKDTSNTREKMTEKLKTPKNDDKKTYIIAQEIKLAKVLAGNNKTLRDRALKRLKRWFQFRSQTTPFTENDFMRIWKGLFYAMWMSDKPLLQEECAEMIASLVHLTTTTYSLMFFKCGLQTLANEWFGIDQLRLDKFLMFVRRLLRQGLVILKNVSWNLKTIKEFNNILSETVLNTENTSQLGLSMHFTEVYLEELAKVSEGNLKPNLMTEFVSPFVKQLAMLTDNRQVTCILKNIFHYLIRQSDFGLEHQQKFEAWKSQGFPGGSIDSMQKDETISDDDNEDVYQNDFGEKVLDPRAGHVDVVLPQLKFIPKQILAILNQNKFVDGSNTKSRKAISTAIKEFTQLSRGEYPLGMKKISISKDDGYSIRTKNAVNRLVKFENKLLNKNKKKRKQKNEDGIEELTIKRKKIDPKSSNEEFEMKLEEFIKNAEGNIKINGKKLKPKDKRKIENGKEIKERPKKIKNDKEEGKLKLNKMNNMESRVKTKKKTKCKGANENNSKNIKINDHKKSLRNKIGVKNKSIEDEPVDKNYECTFERNSGTWFVYDDDASSTSSVLDLTLSDDLDVPINDITPTTYDSFSVTEGDSSSTVLSKISENNFTPTKLIEQNISNSGSFTQNEWDVPLKEGESEIFVESKKYRKKKGKHNSSLIEISHSVHSKLSRRVSLDPSIVKNPFAKSSTPGSSKKVKIALNLNKAQDIKEHVAQIKSSPGIPFDANRKPSKPLLKRHTLSPIDPFYRRKLDL